MKTFVISLATLVIGLFAGIILVKHEDRPPPLDTASPPAKASAVPPTAPNSSPPDADQWDPFTEMRRMQEQMDRMINQSIEKFRSEPGFSGYAGVPSYSLSLDLREFKDRFEVHAALPDAKADDVSVKLEDRRTLIVEIGNESAGNNQQGTASTTIEEWGHYTQTIQLPAAVQAKKMKIQHKDHELVIILPKA